MNKNYLIILLLSGTFFFSNTISASMLTTLDSGLYKKLGRATELAKELGIDLNNTKKYIEIETATIALNTTYKKLNNDELDTLAIYFGHNCHTLHYIDFIDFLYFLHKVYPDKKDGRNLRLNKHDTEVYNILIKLIPCLNHYSKNLEIESD